MSIAKTTWPHLITRASAAARIEALEAALITIRRFIEEDWGVEQIREVVSAALAPEQDK